MTLQSPRFRQPPTLGVSRTRYWKPVLFGWVGGVKVWFCSTFHRRIGWFRALETIPQCFRQCRNAKWAKRPCSAGSDKMVRRSSWLYMYQFFFYRAHWYSAYLRTLTDVHKMMQNAQNVAKILSKKHVVQALLNAFHLVVAPHKHQPETVMSCTQGPWRHFPSHHPKALPVPRWITCPENFFRVEWLWITLANPNNSWANVIPTQKNWKEHHSEVVP